MYRCKISDNRCHLFDHLLDSLESMMVVLLVKVKVLGHSGTSSSQVYRFLVLVCDRLGMKSHRSFKGVQTVGHRVKRSEPVHGLFGANSIQADKLRMSAGWGGSRPMTVSLTATTLRSTMSISQTQWNGPCPSCQHHGEKTSCQRMPS